VFFTACLAILVDSAIGVVQNRTGSLRGLGLDKGAAGEALDYQYAVMGIEDITRATGFSYDSHALGAYLAMLLPYPLVASYASSTSLVARVRYVVVFLIGLVGLVVTFSRAAWLSCAIALGISFLILIALRERYAIVTTIVAGALLVSLTPWFATSLHKRFASAPAELMKARFEQYSVAFDVWRDHPLFGYGAGNYMNALRSYNATGALALPVHNVHLWNLAESGLAGAIAFLSIQLGAMWYCWKAIWRHGGWERRFAVAALTGLIAYFLDGLTDPLFREPVVYLMFWLTVGSIAALTRSHETEAGNGHPPHGPAAAG
jgi:O-antigen ligase